MNWKNVSTFLFFVLLVVLISSAILPVISLQNNTSISSYGTVNYSGLPTPPPTPTPTPSPSPTPSNKIGEVYLWAAMWLRTGDQPSLVAQRIVAAKNAYGNPTWAEAGNWGGGGAGTVNPHLTSTVINYLHSAGIKVSCRLWSAGAGRHPRVSVYDLCHSMDLTYPYGGSVDYQMSIGPEIDMILLDEGVLCSVSELQELANYVHSKGKLFGVNWGGAWFPAEICTFVDIISVERQWRDFIANRQDLIQQYPRKFMAISSGNLEESVAQTFEAWNGGVYYFESRPGISETPLPDWWEEYLNQLPT